MKRFIPFFLVFGLLITNGCISTNLVQNKAKPHLEYEPEEQRSREVEGQPGYYALLPLTIVGDIATSPFQVGYLWLLSDGPLPIISF